jgi:hypothetical protein
VVEKKLSVGEALKTFGFMVLAIAGFFVLWGMAFILSLPFTPNIGVSIPVSFVISAVITGALVTIFPRKRSQLVLSKRQEIGVYVAYAVIFVASLPLIKIDLPLFLGLLPTLIVTLLVVIIGSSKRKEA